MSTPDSVLPPVWARSDLEAALVAYLDAELPPQQARDLEQYLDRSPALRRELDDLRRVIEAVQHLPAVSAPDDFYQHVARKLRRRPNASNTALFVLSLQVLSVIVILAVAAISMMAELARDSGPLIREHASSSDRSNSNE